MRIIRSAFLIAVFLCALANADSISIIRDTSYDWACADESGAIISAHTRQDKAIESCVNRSLSDGLAYRVIPGAYRVKASIDTVPIPDPIPAPTPDPIPEPIPMGNYRGIPDPSAAFGFDIDGVYKSTFAPLVGPQGQSNLSCIGTAALPCLIDATEATFTAVGLSGEYVILQGGKVNAPAASGAFVSMANCIRCVIRDMEVAGPGTDQSHSSAVWLGDNNVWLRGSIHGFGDNRATTREQDFHGMKIQADSVWVIDAEIYNVSGDSVQCGDASRGECTNVYIGGGWFHDNRENAVDIKDSRNVVVSNVRMNGFGGTQSDPGAAVVIHDDAFNAKIYDNNISDARIGVVTSGVSGHAITNNTIQATFRGIECRNTSGLTITGNVISAPTRIERMSNCNGEIQQ